MTIWQKLKFRNLLQTRSQAMAVFLLSILGICFALVSYNFLSYEKQSAHYQICQNNQNQFFLFLHFFEKSYIQNQYQDTLVRISKRIDHNFELLLRGGNYKTQKLRKIQLEPDLRYAALVSDLESIWRNLKPLIENPSDTSKVIPYNVYEGIVQDTEKILLLNQSLCDSYRQSYMDQQKEWYFYVTLCMGVLVVVIIFVYYNIKIGLVIPVKKTISELQDLVQGKVLKDHRLIESEDEIALLKKNTHLLSMRLAELSDFANQVGKGNFEKELSLNSKDDILGMALLEMKLNLQKAAQSDQVRNWINENLAFFSDLLRKRYEDSTELSYEIISNLVKLLKANQGGIFILNQETQMLHLEASYAYNRRKFQEKILPADSGLIGQAIIEKTTLLLTEIPQNYVHISSGLGESTPNCLLIVPMVDNEVIYGIIEIASFRKFTDYQVNFIERISQNIASTLADKKNTERISKLLEDANFLREQSQAQEEEIRQNLEELAATQEEMSRVQRELSIKTHNLNNILDSLGDYVIAVNSNFEIMVSNQGIKNVFGDKVQTGKIFFSIIRREEKKRWNDALHKAFLGQSSWWVSNYKNTNTAGDYEDRFFEHHLYPMFKEEKIIGVVVVSRNINHLQPIRWYSDEGQGTDAAF